LPSPELLVDFLQLVVTSTALLTAADTSDNTLAVGQEETGPVTTVLIKALREWAQSNDDEAAEGIARAVTNYLLATTGSPGDLAQILGAFRTTATALTRQASNP
jgi:hypothetical protein